MDRRRFLGLGALGTAAALAAPRLLADAFTTPAAAAGGPYGQLLAPNADGIRLPAGFTSRVVARSGEAVPGTTLTWHDVPDGGACFALPDGGWVYASNCELGGGRGGASALAFDARGRVAAATRILSGTSRNCAGGATPWGTWLSCEEVTGGRVWEADPLTGAPAVARPALGRFSHEAAACDPVRRCLYLTEDARGGKLRRFRPTTWGDLSTGTLEAMVVGAGQVRWTTAIAEGTGFDGGEGAWYAAGRLWFTTKHDNRVWEVDLVASTIKVLYDVRTSPTPVLRGVDNITGAANGDLFVAEDGGDLELVLVEAGGAASPFLRLEGQAGSELAGPAFSPDGSRLYLSSQRGGPAGRGLTYEVTGPFRR